MYKLVKILTQKQLTLCTCESFTGGLMASKICEIPGASKVFSGSLVVYNRQSKVEIVHIDPKIIDQYGTISPQVVTEMAEKARMMFKTNYAVAFSGNAGPSSQEDVPIGLWYGAIADGHKTLIFGGLSNLNRNDLREAAVEKAKTILLQMIRNS